MSGSSQSYGRQIFTLIISVAIVMTGFGIIFPIFPQLLEIVGGGDSFDLGVMAAAFGLSYLIASPIFGNLADAFGKKRVILIGLLGFSTSNLVYVYATEIWHFYLARAIEGAFSSAILPPAIALTTQITPQNKRAKYIGYIAAGNTIGLIIGPLIGGVLFDGLNIQGTTIINGSLYLPFYASFTVGLIAFIFGFFTLPQDSNHNISVIPPITKGKSDDVSSQKSFRRVINHQISTLPKPLHMFLIFVIADMFTILPWMVVSPGFIFHFYDELDLSASDFGYFVAGYGLFAATGQALLGNLSDKHGRKPLLLIGQLFAIAFYLMLPLGRLAWHFVLIATLAGISSGLRDPALKAMLSDVTDEKSRATAFGIESGFISLSQIIGPILGGYLYVTYGIGVVFTVSIILATVNILFIGLIRFYNYEDGNLQNVKEYLSSLSETRDPLADSLVEN
ncbi:MAG: MFS transporter [Candidatus Kariarchaeaceae archaeon]|jgi:DHA1 family multidrug resistance protein-like MFS transporter